MHVAIQVLCELNLQTTVLQSQALQLQQTPPPPPAAADAAGCWCSWLLMQLAVDAAGDWLSSWHSMVNASKTVTMRFSGKDGFHPSPQSLPVSLYGTALTTVSSHHHLGTETQRYLRWATHINSKICSASKLLFLVRCLRPSITPLAMAQIYTTYICPKLEYTSHVYSSLSGEPYNKLERFQCRAAGLCLSLPLFHPVNHMALLHRVDWPTLSSCRQYVHPVFAFHLYLVSPHLLALLPQQPRTPTQCLCQYWLFSLPTTCTCRQQDSPIYLACHKLTHSNQKFPHLFSPQFAPVQLILPFLHFTPS